MIGNELIDPDLVPDSVMNDTLVAMQEEGIFLRVREQKRFDRKKLPGVEVMYTYLPNYKFEYFMEPVWNSQEQRSIVQCVVPHSSSVESGSVDTDDDDDDYDDDEDEEDEEKEREALELQKREVRIKTEYVDNTERYQKGQGHGLSLSEVNCSYRGGDAAEGDLPDFIKERDDEGNEEESVGAVLSTLEEDILVNAVHHEGLKKKVGLLEAKVEKFRAQRSAAREVAKQLEIEVAQLKMDKAAMQARWKGKKAAAREVYQKVLEKSATLENQVKELTFKYNELVDSNTYLRLRPSSSSQSVENSLWKQPYQSIPESVWDELPMTQT